MRRRRKFPSDLRSPSTFTPAAYRLDAFRINYRKGGLIGPYVYLVFQKPFRESPSSGTSHSRSRGQLHDRNEKTAATKIPRSAGDAARLCARYHHPSSLDGAECHYDLQKRLTRRRQQQADDAHSSLIKLRGSVLSAGHFTLSHYAELFSETENDVLSPSKAVFPLALPAPLSAPYGDAHRASYAKTRKESQDPRDRKSSLGNAPRHRPCHWHHALGE